MYIGKTRVCLCSCVGGLDMYNNCKGRRCECEYILRQRFKQVIEAV